jgi:hypothetical protein
MVKPGLHPGVAAIAINADGDIPFHHHAVLMGIVDRVPELEMQVVLDKILKEDSVVMGRAGRCILLDDIGLVVPVDGPGGKIRGMVFVPEITKGRIGDEPGAIPIKKFEKIGVLLKFFFL